MAKERVLVIGGGHNGLVAAAYLAKAGKDVTLLERSDTVGGILRNSEIAPGSPRRASRTPSAGSGSRSSRT